MKVQLVIEAFAFDTEVNVHTFVDEVDFVSKVNAGTLLPSRNVGHDLQVKAILQPTVVLLNLPQLLFGDRNLRDVVEICNCRCIVKSLTLSVVPTNVRFFITRSLTSWRLDPINTRSMH